MGMYSDSDLIMRQMRVMQLIVVALAVGVLIFLGVAVMSPPNVQGQMPEWFLPYVILPFSGVALLLFLLVPNIVTRVARSQIAQSTTTARPGRSGADTQKLLNVYFARTLIRAALLESVAFLLLVAYMMDPKQWYLFVAAGLAAAILALFPTQNGVENWLDRQKQALSEDRMQVQAR